jgi:hypothetical protein
MQPISPTGEWAITIPYTLPNVWLLFHFYFHSHLNPLIVVMAGSKISHFLLHCNLQDPATAGCPMLPVRITVTAADGKRTRKIMCNSIPLQLVTCKLPSAGATIDSCRSQFIAPISKDFVPMCVCGFFGAGVTKRVYSIRAVGSDRSQCFGSSAENAFVAFQQIQTKFST